MANQLYERYVKEYQKTPMGKYIRHRANARRRGIPWEFTFETWMEMWEKSGKWEERGRAAGQYCMSRLLDEGPYSPENCRIVKMEANSRQVTDRQWPKADNQEWEPTPWHLRKSAWDIYS